MQITRREFALGLAMSASAPLGPTRDDRRTIALVLAPSNLGLRPLKAGHVPGAWRAPEVLLSAGLDEALDADEVIALQRPVYDVAEQAGTRVRNGRTLREFSLDLGGKVHAVLQRERFPVVIGGDCSILLGCLYGGRLAGARGLVHIDGHSDFSHPGNYDASKVLGSAAGMDLALVSGRGEPMLTQWPQVGAPLVNDADIVQIGERNVRDPRFMQYYGDILNTEITQLSIQSALAEGVEVAAHRAIGRLTARALDRAWLHVDLDVLDAAVMPAVDSPGSPGFDYQQLGQLIAALCASRRIIGVDFAIYDPDMDPQLRYARPLVECIGSVKKGLGAAD